MKRLRRRMCRLRDFIYSTPIPTWGLLHNWRSSLLVPFSTSLRRAALLSQVLYRGVLSPTHTIADSVQDLHINVSSEFACPEYAALTHQEIAFRSRRRSDRGGGPRDLTPRYIRPTKLSPDVEDLLPLDNDEDWYPLYVLQASKLATPNPEHSYQHEVIQHEVFQDMSLASLKQTLASMGVPFQTNLAPIRHLLPQGPAVSCGYPSRTVPSIDISQLSLEEVLTHVRVVYQRMARLQKAREKVKRRLGSLYSRRCKKSPRLRNIAIEELTSELYKIRAAINQYDDLHKRLCRKSKSRLRETVKRLPKTICVPLIAPTIPTSNRFAILDEDNTENIFHWSDLLAIPQPMSMGEVVTPDPLPTSLLDPAPVAAPLDTLLHLRRDMGALAPTLTGQVPDMAYGIIGGYKSTQAATDRTLSVMTLNVNGLTQHKLPMLCRMLQQDHVDVLICVDTRHSIDQARSFTKKFREQFGAGTSSYFSKDPARKHGEPGGVSIIVGPRWGTSIDHNSSRTDLSGHGVLTRIRLNTESGYLSIYGTYWPFVPSSGLSDDGNAKLWNRVREYCRSKRMHDSDPITYIHSLIDQWMSRDWEDQCIGVIIGGDFNSTWSKGEPGGQRILSSWAESRFLINGPRLIQDKCRLPFFTYGKLNSRCNTWIDHILHAGSIGSIDILGAFNDQGPFFEDLSDNHRSLIAVYRTPLPAGKRVVRMPKAPPRPELPRSDRHQIATFKTELRDALRRVTQSVSTPDEAEYALDNLAAYTVQLVRSINSEHRQRQGCRRKDGYSPEYILRKIHYCGVLEIRRHLTGQHGKSRWGDYATVQAGIRYIFRVMTSRGESMGITPASIHRILNVDRASSIYFLSLPSAPTTQACDEALRVLRLKLQGRARTDMRLAHKGYMSFIESNREKGRLKPIVKAILGSHAGRRHQDGLVMDTITQDDGEVIGDPARIHSIWTEHYKSVFKMPIQFDNELHTTEDWGPILADKTRFMNIYRESNIPQWCLDIIFEALQMKPQAAEVQGLLQISLAEPPSLADLYKSIRRAKTNSAPGPSGLSYNMLKSMPREMIEYIHMLLVTLWHGRHRMASWGWRWLHLISKTIKDNFGVKDCRPIMLCEALRKLWSGAILTRVSAALTRCHVLEEVQHGFTAGKGTDTASILHLNYVEDVEERSGVSHLSSFDLQAAFDSVSIPCQYWSLRRVGVPANTAHDMATADVGGTTVVRSPFAEFLWSQLPYQCVKTTGTTPIAWFTATDDSAQIESFCPERGTGQGAIDSPLKWNLVFDIIATGLRILDQQEATPILVVSEDNEVYEHKDLLYADDHLAPSEQVEKLQKKADLVSAFCIVLGLKLSHTKIRRVVQHFTHPRNADLVMSTTVYSAGWIPHVVPAHTSGAIEFLGGIYDVDNTGSSTLEWLKTKATVAVQCIRSRKSFSSAAKIGVLNISIMGSMLYKALNSVLSHTELESIDTIIDDVLISTTNNMFSFPRKLLHISRELGGHGLPLFSFDAESRKLQRLFSCMRSQQSQNFAARGLLSRVARQHGILSSPGQKLVIIPGETLRVKQKTYCDGPITMLAQHGLFLCRHGHAPTIEDPCYPLVQFFIEHQYNLARISILNGLYTLGDLTSVRDGATQWYIPEDLSTIRDKLPHNPPFSAPTLLIGQFWQPFTTHAHRKFHHGDVLRIDGRHGEYILATRFSKIRSSTLYIQAPGQLSLPYEEIFTRSLVTRCHLTRQSDGRHVKSHVRYQHAPIWGGYTTQSTPAWISWITTQLSQLGPSYVARPYTDGSHEIHPNIRQYFRPDTTHITATAAIIIKDDTADWKSKPVLAIHIQGGHDIGAQAAYTMEFLALAASLQATVLADGKLHATGSDAKSVLDLIPGRRQRLQHVMKDHHYLLQSIDNSLFRGAPMPYKVPSHVERHKPLKDAHGRLGVNWTKDEWGNWLADRVAADDTASLRRQGIRYHILTVPARDIYAHLMFPGQWYIGDNTGFPVLPLGVSAAIHTNLHKQYLVERDAYRIARGDLPKWEKDSSMPHSASVYGLKQAHSNSLPTKIRIIYDKGYHGGNRAKNTSITPAEREIARTCRLCQKPDSQDHWLQECDFGPLRRLRNDIMTSLNQQLLAYRDKSALHRQLSIGFKHVLMTTQAPARIWTGNWSSEQIDLLTNLINPTLLEKLQKTTISSILQPLEKILAEGAQNLWQCKVIQERKVPQPDKQISISTVAKTNSRIDILDVKRTDVLKAKRHNPPIVITPSTGSQLIMSIVFPTRTKSSIRALEVASRADRTSKTILVIDGHHIYGVYFGKLCKTKDDGHLHFHIITGFLHVLQKTTSSCIQCIRPTDLTATPSLITGSGVHPSVNKWTVLILPNTLSQHDIFEAALCYNHSTNILHYLHLDTTTEASKEEHMRSASRFRDIYNIPEQAFSSHIGSRIDDSDSGIWLCIAMQFLIENIEMPRWSFDTASEARTYIATCLLQKRCAPAHDLLVMTTTTEYRTESHDDSLTTLADLLPDVYCPTDDELDGELPTYNMLHPRYVYIPCTNHTVKQKTHRGGTDIFRHHLSSADKEFLMLWCRETPPTETLYADALRGTVNATDILQLLCPSMLSFGLLTHLLFSQFPISHPSVTVVDEGIMGTIFNRTWGDDYLDINSLNYHTLHALLATMWTKEWIVFPFLTGSHFHGVLAKFETLDIDTGHTLRGNLYSIDSFLSEDISHSARIKEFLEWTYALCTPSITAGHWEISLRPTGDMVRQHMYLAPGQHEDLKLHIDCALYFFFISIQLIAGGRVDGLSPEGVHHTRPILAWHLVTRRQLPDVSFWFELPVLTHLSTPLSHSVSDTMDQVLIPRIVEGQYHTLQTSTTDNVNSNHPILPLHDDNRVFSSQEDRLPYDLVSGAELVSGTTCHSNPSDTTSRLLQRSRRILPRKVKIIPEPPTETTVPMPRGRQIIHQYEQTYIAKSTISDDALGIDAGYGLFASRPFKAKSTIKNDDLICYYEGAVMSREELKKIENDPTYTGNTGFIINYRGLIINGWDDDNDFYAGPGAVVNDFLDDRNNSYFSIESLDEDSDEDEDEDYKSRKRSRKKSIPSSKSSLISKCLAIRSDSHSDIQIHQEIGVAYGEHHFCKVTVPIAVLFKAARYYWNDIMQKQERIDRWSRLPQARYLFNSPYHGAAPQTKDATVQRILKHLTQCQKSNCHCDLDGYLQKLQRQNADTTSIRMSVATGGASRRHRFLNTSGDQECTITRIVPLGRVPRRGPFTPPAARTVGTRHNGDILCFHKDTSDWLQLDANCSQTHDVSHYINSSDPRRYSLLTEELQDLRSGMLGCEVVHRYFSILCASSVDRNVQHFTPVYTSLMAGLVTQSGVNPHTHFEDRHLFCDWLLCPIVHDLHISYVTVCYNTCTMIHEDSKCGIHKSEQIFRGIEKFFQDNIIWRQEHNLPLRSGLTMTTRWTRIAASTTTTAQQGDGVSCGVLTCGNATCRVHGMPGFPCGQSYVPQLRLHIYHCIMQNTFFPITLSDLTESIRDRMFATGNWYERNKPIYNEILRNRRERPRPKPTALVGQGTVCEPFVLDDEIPRPEHTAKRHSETFILPDHNDDIYQTSPSKSAATHKGSHSRETSHIRKRPNQLITESEYKRTNPTETVSITPDVGTHKLRRSAIRARERSKGYAAKCRRDRLEKIIPHTDTILSLSPSQRTQASLLELAVQDTTDISFSLSDQPLRARPVPEDSGSLAAKKSNRKRDREVQEVLHSPSIPPQTTLLHDKKRKFTKKRNLGYARQKTTMDAFVSRFKDPSSTRIEASGGSAATGVVSQPTLVIHNVSDNVMPVDHVELIGQIEHDYSCEFSPPKRVRKAQEAAFSPVSSTLLEYDKRIADS